MIAACAFDSKLVVRQAQSRASQCKLKLEASTFKSWLAYAAAARIDGEEVAR
jgi:hypothetical protein